MDNKKKRNGKQNRNIFSNGMSLRLKLDLLR